jgi:predicted acetyltransferase
MSGPTRQPRLVAPSAGLHASFLRALAEYHGEGRLLHLDGARLADAETFARFAAALRLEASDVRGAWRDLGEIGLLPYENVDPEQLVPETVLWWAEEDEYLGRISIRHRLNEALMREGGNVGYDVRPTARRAGHATAMLAAALPVAAGLGIDRARIDCDVGNTASRRVIEKNGGRLEKEERGSLYFWVPTGGAAGRPGTAPGGESRESGEAGESGGRCETVGRE